MINCDKTKELMSAFIEDEIDPEMKKEVAQHLSFCPACKILFNRTMELLTAMSSMNPYSVSNNFDSGLENKLARLRRAEKNSSKNSFIKGAFIGAAAAGLIFFSFNEEPALTPSSAKYSASSLGTKLTPTSVLLDSIKVDSLHNSSRVKKQVDKNLQMVTGRN